MITTTTHTVDGRQIRQYLGLVTGEAIMGANVIRDFMAGLTDLVGGRSGTYESKSRKPVKQHFKRWKKKRSAKVQTLLSVLTSTTRYSVPGTAC